MKMALHFSSSQPLASHAQHLVIPLRQLPERNLLTITTLIDFVIGTAGREKSVLDQIHIFGPKYF